MRSKIEASQTMFFNTKVKFFIAIIFIVILEVFSIIRNLILHLVPIEIVPLVSLRGRQKANFSININLV